MISQRSSKEVLYHFWTESKSRRDASRVLFEEEVGKRKRGKRRGRHSLFQFRTSDAQRVDRWRRLPGNKADGEEGRGAVKRTIDV